MQSERLESYVNTILKDYMPACKESADHEIKYNFHIHKANQLMLRIMTFPSDVDVLIKQRITKTAKQKLMDAYMSLSSELKH